MANNYYTVRGIFRVSPSIDQVKLRRHRRSRPRGVMSCEIIGFVGNTHPAEGDFRPFGLTTRMSKIVSFPATDVGKTAWYRFRWINTRGQEGPWSTTYTATITR